MKFIGNLGRNLRPTFPTFIFIAILYFLPESLSFFQFQQGMKYLRFHVPSKNAAISSNISRQESLTSANFYLIDDCASHNNAKK